MKNFYLIFLCLVGFQACVTMPPIILSPKAKAVAFILTGIELNEWLHENCKMKGVLEGVDEEGGRLWAAANDANLVEIIYITTIEYSSYSKEKTFDGVGFHCESFDEMPGRTFKSR